MENIKTENIEDENIYYSFDKEKNTKFLFINFDNIELNDAVYGTYDKNINVLEMLIKFITDDTILLVNNRTFKKDPHHRKFKFLTLTINENKTYNLSENEELRPKCKNKKLFLERINPILKKVKKKIEQNKIKKEEIKKSNKYYINCNFFSPNIGFIILRNVINKKTNKLWINCYESIRKFYSNRILIIDDNSNQDFLTVDYKMKNYSIIYSEFKGRGELLPYYYYNTNPFCERVIVLHDSMRIEEFIDFENINDYTNYTKIFSFNNRWYNQDIKYLGQQLKSLNKANELITFHKENKNKLTGCAGNCYVIDHEFVKNIFEKYKLTRLLKCIKTREQRKSLERTLACVFEYEKKTRDFQSRNELFETIHDHIGKQSNNKKVSIYKDFVGR